MSDDNMESRLAVLESAIPRIESSMAKIAEGVDSLARLEERHQAMSDGLRRAFEAISALEKLADERLEKIEKEMPTLKLARNAVLAFASLCTVTVISVLLYKAGLLVAGH